ncbi:tetratricopeptide repeat protein [Agrococcus sp. ARC_14]|uniref:tetratricopeptide repeat protein n=1 Tax=Agrococcus sp. ARC_14 TaxID=2919927 RepID=UPI001F065BDE|nr:tetratricopeptide repeat protein [Agrococcus sp. ARC_14]MCH1882780.1 tetratricopeptide repeat protein [Agrococcus sp. ARC_14]
MTQEHLPASIAGAVDLSALAARHARAADPEQAAGGGAAPAAPGVVISIGDADLNTLVELSSRVPVIIAIVAEWSEPSQQLMPVLERLVQAQRGKLVLAKVDGERSPQIVQAFQSQSVPTVAAIIGGRPAPLFTGSLPEDQLQDMLAQVLEFAAQQGVTGSVPMADTAEGEEAAEPAPAPVPPLHQEAYDAIDAGDYPTGIAAFEKAIAQNPRDAEAVAGLAQVRLLARLHGRSADEIREAAAAAPTEIDAQMLVADLDLSGGHVEDAFLRMLDLIGSLQGDEKQDARLRLLDLFEIVGHDDARVAAARKRLTTLLY